MFTLAKLVTLVLLTQADRAERKVTIMLARTGLTCQDLRGKEREQEREQANTAVNNATTFKEKVLAHSNHLFGEATAQSNRLMGKGDPALSGYGIIRLGEIKQKMPKVDMAMAASSTAAVWTAGILFDKTIHTARMLTVRTLAPNNKAIEQNLDNFQAPKEIQLSDKYDATTSYTDKNQNKRWETFEQVLVSKVLPDLAQQKGEFGDMSDIVIGVVVDSSMFKFKAGCAKAEGRVSAGQVVKLDFTWQPKSENGRDASPTGKFFLQTGSACTAMVESGTSFDGDFCEADLGVCKGMISANDTTYKRIVEQLPHAQRRLQKATEAATKAADVAAKAKQDRELASKELTETESVKASADDEWPDDETGSGSLLANAKTTAKTMAKTTATMSNNFAKEFALGYHGTLDEKAEAAEYEREKLKKDFEEVLRLAKEERERLSTLTCKNGQQIELAPVSFFSVRSLSSAEFSTFE